MAVVVGCTSTIVRVPRWNSTNGWIRSQESGVCAGLYGIDASEPQPVRSRAANDTGDERDRVVSVCRGFSYGSSTIAGRQLTGSLKMPRFTLLTSSRNGCTRISVKSAPRYSSFTIMPHDGFQCAFLWAMS